MKNSTRYYSNKQEKQVAKAIGGKQVVNSGATEFRKGDVQSDLFLIECKTTVKKSKSFSIKEDWLLKNKEEAFAMNKSYSILAFNFGPDEKSYYILDEKTFKKVMELLTKEEE